MNVKIEIEILEYLRQMTAISKRLPPLSAVRILSFLNDNQDISQQMIADYLKIQPQSASEHIRKLEQRGIVVRTPSPNDRRVIRINLTEDGKKMAGNAADMLSQQAEDLIACLSQPEKVQLAQLLKKIIIAANNPDPELIGVQERSEADNQPEPELSTASVPEEKHIICSCRNHRCVVTWNEFGDIFGYLCKSGREAALETIAMRRLK